MCFSVCKLTTQKIKTGITHDLEEGRFWKLGRSSFLNSWSLVGDLFGGKGCPSPGNTPTFQRLISLASTCRIHHLRRLHKKVENGGIFEESFFPTIAKVACRPPKERLNFLSFSFKWHIIVYIHISLHYIYIYIFGLTIRVIESTYEFLVSSGDFLKFQRIYSNNPPLRKGWQLWRG